MANKTNPRYVWPEGSSLSSASCFKEVIQPWYYFGNTIGLCSYYIHADDGIKLRRSKLKLVYNITLLAVLVFCSVYLFPKFPLVRDVSYTVTLIDHCSYSFFSFLFCLVFILTMHSTETFYRSIQHVDTALELQGYSLPHGKLKKRAYLIVIFLLSLWCFAFTKHLLLKPRPYSISEFHAFASYLLRMAILAKILIFLDQIKERFTGVNQMLLPDNIPSRKIKALRILHGQVCGSVDCLNRAVSMPVCLLIMSAMTNVVVNGFYVYNTLSRGEVTPNAIRSFIVLCQFALEFIYMVYCFARTTDEGCKVGKILLDQVGHTEDELTLRELNTFLTQLVHVKCFFTCGGLFTLDCGLLCSIGGAVTTYLIILIQFKD